MTTNNPDADEIEFLVSDEPHYSKWLCPTLTLYIGQETGKIIGGLVGET